LGKHAGGDYALVKNNSFWEPKAGVEEKLANCFSGPARIIFGHERIPAANDRILDLAQPVLEPLASRIRSGANSRES
jgi:hypothetical protein